MRSLAGPYFALQGAAVLLWWGALLRWPALRAHFRPAGSPDADLLAFWLPDLLLLAGGSLAAARLCARCGRWLGPVAWAVAGAAVYATLYCLALSLLTGAAWLSVALMAPAALLSTLSARVCHAAVLDVPGGGAREPRA